MRLSALTHSRFWPSAHIVAVLAVWIGVVGVVGADDAARRERFEPMLLLETGARMAACDVLVFSNDGKRLFATGDDKVVRVWKVTDQGLELENVLRWSVWREQRGSIYALALSPDSDNRFVAVGGLGVRNGTAAVINRTSGEVVHAITDVKGNDQVIWAITFSPTGSAVAFGTNDGSVWLWNLGGGVADGAKKNDLRKLGQHPNKSGRVVRVAYRGPNQLLTVAADGSVLEWATDQPNAAPKKVCTLSLGGVFQAQLSPDHRFLVAAAEKQERHKDNLEIYDLKKEITVSKLNVGENAFPQSLAFNAKGTRLAVGVRIVPEAPFFKELGSRVIIYDLSGGEPRPEPGPKTGLRAEAMAFHPDGNRFAVAGGDNHEVTLWDLRALDRKPVAEARGPGSCLWGVGLSADGRLLGFRDQRLLNPPAVNDRAQGPWRVFDLRDRQWVAPTSFRPVAPLETAGGWRVVPDDKSAFDWYVKNAAGKSYRLPLTADYDDRPWCFTFLRAENGRPVRLAVGHYWGVSVFELEDAGPKRIKLMIGHQGTVTALAPSEDGQLLVSASRDQTVAAWGTADWPSSWLGAKFAARLGRLYVDDVDRGGPAWEAGLAKGDEIVLLQSDKNQLLFDKDRVLSPEKRKLFGIKKVVEEAERCATFLMKGTLDDTKLELGRELLFDVLRDGEKLSLLTRGYQRPLWRFFPTRDGEWALWRSFDYFYDCSTNGDKYLGWQVSREADQTPEFYPLRGREGSYKRPDKVSEIILKPHFDPNRLNLADVEPPALALVANAEVVADKPLELQLKALPRGAREVHRPERVVLWVGDYRYRTWDGNKIPKDGKFHESVTLQPADLRRGANVLTLQCFNRAGSSEAIKIGVRKEAPAAPANLYVVLVGVANYNQTKPPVKGRPFEPLPGTMIDLERLELAWNAQARKKNKLYQTVNILPPLENEKATPEAVLLALDGLAKQAKPDDLVVFFYSGHGWTETGEKKDVKPGTLVFVGPNFDAARPSETGLTPFALSEALTKIRCRKLVLLNACHSGDATAGTLRDPIREMTPGGVGPTILTASRHEENAFVDAIDGSLFAQAIAEALKKLFDKPDVNQDGQLDLQALAAFVQRRVPAKLKELQTNDPGRFEGAALHAVQTPCCFPDLQAIERFPIAVRK